MKNFLGRLVERARGKAPRIEPLLAPHLTLNLAPELPQTARPEKSNAPTIRAADSGSEKVFAPTTEAGDLSATTESNIIVRQNLPNESQPRIEVVEETLLLPPESSPPREDEIARPVSASPPDQTGPALPTPQTILPRRLNAGKNFAPAKAQERFAVPPNESSLEGPIVRVTIGRIDVHAAPAPAAAKRRTARENPPRLTLDDYLKSRKENAR